MFRFFQFNKMISVGFDGNTRLYTRRGIFKIKELVDQEIELQDINDNWILSKVIKSDQFCKIHTIIFNDGATLKCSTGVKVFTHSSCRYENIETCQNKMIEKARYNLEGNNSNLDNCELLINLIKCAYLEKLYSEELYTKIDLLLNECYEWKKEIMTHFISLLAIDENIKIKYYDMAIKLHHILKYFGYENILKIHVTENWYKLTLLDKVLIIDVIKEDGDGENYILNNLDGIKVKIESLICELSGSYNL